MTAMWGVHRYVARLRASLKRLFRADSDEDQLRPSLVVTKQLLGRDPLVPNTRILGEEPNRACAGFHTSMCRGGQIHVTLHPPPAEASCHQPQSTRVRKS